MLGSTQGSPQSPRNTQRGSGVMVVAGRSSYVAGSLSLTDMLTMRMRVSTRDRCTG